MHCHYIGWCIGKCPLCRGVLYSECPLSEVPQYSGNTSLPLKEDNLSIMDKMIRPSMSV